MFEEAREKSGRVDAKERKRDNERERECEGRKESFPANRREHERDRKRDI